MKWEDVDNKIGMPDVDAEWRRFESEIINQKPTSRRLLYWGISIAASIIMVMGLSLFIPDAEEPQLQLAKLEKTANANAHVENNGNIVKEVVIIGSGSVGHLVFLTNHTDGERLAERLHIHVDSASSSWKVKHRQMAHYKREKARLMSLENMSFGIGCEPSLSNEWVLYYDSVAHTLVYKEADKNIWQATRRAVLKERKGGKEKTTKWVPRRHPKRCKGIRVKRYSMPITDEQAQGLNAMWTEVVDSVNNNKAFLLEDATYEFPLGELRVTAPKGINPIIAFTDKLTEAVQMHNTISRDSLLTNFALEKCLTDMTEAMKPVHFIYDSLIIVVSKRQLPDSLCKQIRYRFRQYYHQQGLIVDREGYWTPYGAKWSSGYDKNCPIIELTTAPDTLSDDYVNQHPELQQTMRHISGVVLDENNRPLADAWVGCYGKGAGAPTDSAGCFSFWLPLSYAQSKGKLYAECRPGYQIVRNITIADTAIIIRLQQAVAKGR